MDTYVPRMSQYCWTLGFSGIKMFPWDRYSTVCEARALFKITSFCDYTTITSFPLPSPLSRPSPIPFFLLPFKFMAPFNCCYISIGGICFCVYVCVYVYPDTYIYSRYINTTRSACILSLVGYVFSTDHVVLDNQLVCPSLGKSISFSFWILSCMYFSM